jgi:short-subunit dehydrogenase
MRAQIDKQRFGPWAVITGASSGIGKEFAHQIAASGVHVALVARREPLLQTVGAECTKASGVQHRIIRLDLSEPDFLPVLADATRDLDVGSSCQMREPAVLDDFSIRAARNSCSCCG